MSAEDQTSIDIERERVRASARRAVLGSGARFTVGRFELLGWLGAGAMGFVYDALDTDLHRKVALKVLDQDLPPDVRAERGARLLREARALARVDHPNVVKVHEVGRDHGHIFIAMEKLEGSALDAWLRARTPEPAEILDVLVGAGRGLAAVHSKGLAHRDFKPSNVVVTADRRGVLVDFGLVRATERTLGPQEPTLTRTGVTVGTPSYMSPEQLRGEAGDALSDQFAFCVVLFEALVGRRPYEGINPADLAAHIAEGRVDDDGRLASNVRDVLRRGLSSEPDARFPTLDTLLDALEGKQARIADRYVLEKRIGEGGSGVVHRARDHVRGELVALKILHRDRDLELLREVGSVRHRALVEILDVGRTSSGKPYIAMARVDGVTLRDRLGKIAPRAIVRIVSEIAEGLAALHAAGFVHRDVKPDNILIVEDRAVLVDLDIAIRVDAGGGEIQGTTPYLAPEQARGRAVTPATDQFALAVTAYEALVGHRPWTGDATTVMAKLAVESPPRPSHERKQLPARVDHVLLRALAKSPTDRYPDVRTFAQALRSSFARRTGAIASACVGVLAVMLAAFALTPESHPLSERGVLACPIFEADGVPAPNQWLGAAAADLTCHRATWSLGGRPERTLVPAELLELSALGGDDFPKLPFDADGALAQSRERAKTLDAWIDGRVELRDWEYEVTLTVRRGDEALGSSRGRSDLLVSAVSDAVDALEQTGALPRLPIDPEVSGWWFPQGEPSAEIGWTFESIFHLKPTHPDTETACARIAEWSGVSPLAFSARTLCESDEPRPAHMESPAMLAATVLTSTDVTLPPDVAARLEAARAETSSDVALSILAAAEAIVHRREDDEDRARALWVTALGHAPKAHWIRLEMIQQSIGNASLTGMVNTRQAWDPSAAFGYVQSAWWGGQAVDDVAMLQRRAHVLARWDAPVSVHAIIALLSARRVDDAQIVAAELAATPHASPSARAVGQAMVDSWGMRVGHAIDRLKAALLAVDGPLRDAYTGDTLAVLALRKLAELTGRERELADWFVDAMLPAGFPRTDGALTMPITALCMYASPERASRCLDHIEALPSAAAHDRYDGIDEYIRGARSYAHGNVHEAVEAWRGLPSAYYFAASLPSHAFDDAGEPELGARCDEVKMSRRPYAGLSRAQPSMARRAAARGETDRARELAREVIEAWNQADVRIPAVEEMRTLLDALMLDANER